jgi:hypothetical protein
MRRERCYDARMRILVALSLYVAIAACKEKSETPTPAPKTPAQSTQPATQKPSLPAAQTTPVEVKPTQPISVDEAKTALPKLGGTEVIGLKQTSDQRQVHGTWCLDGTSADDVAKQVGHALAQEKYTNISIRGDARKAGVSGERGELRFSMVVSASSAAVCAAPAHYFASATIFKP